MEQASTPDLLPVGGATRPGTTWQARSRTARLLRVVVVLAPLAGSLLATWALRPFLPAPRGLTGTLFFVGALMLVAFGAGAATSRITRWLLPLASLLELSLVFPDKAPSRYAAALRAGSPRRLKQQVEEIRANRFSDDRVEAAEQVLDMLEALRRHEPRTRGHSERVRAYSDLIARELGMADDERARLQWGVLLHDIGKLAVPASLLNKDGRPTEEEWLVIRRHPEVGARMVEPLASWLGSLVHAAGQHHERWDGTGYPRGLAGEQISLIGRIVAVADAYDVITSARAYKQPLDAAAARRELVAGSGTQFDPDVVKAMLQVAVGNIGTRVGWFAWLAHLPSLFQPGAIGSGLAGTTVAVAATVTGIVPPPVESMPDELAFTVSEDSDGRDQVGTGDGTTGPNDTVVEESSLVSTVVSTAGSGPLPTDGSASTAPPTGDISSSISPTSSPPPTTSSSATSSSAPSVTVDTLPETTTTPSSTPTSAPSSTPTSATTGACALARAGEKRLPSADLAGCDLSGLSLDGVDLSGADLRDADLTASTVTGFNLAGAGLAGATLSGAILTDGNMVGVDLVGVDAIGTRIERVDMASTALEGASFVDATLVDVSFGFAVGSADFSRARLTGVNFNDAGISGSMFDGALVVGVEWWRTVARDASLSGADVSGAVFGQTDLTGATGTPIGHAAATYQGAVCPDGSVRSVTCW